MKNVLAYSMFALIIIGLIDIAMQSKSKKKIKQSVANKITNILKDVFIHRFQVLEYNLEFLVSLKDNSL